MEGEFVDIQPTVDYPLRDNYPYFGDGTGRSEPVTIRNIKIRSDTDDIDADDLHKKDTMRRSPLFSQPTGTLKYTVEGSDTLNSIALHFESTPTQLMRLNHLSSRMLFPGQTLYVPDPDSPVPICLSPSSTTKKTFDLPVVSQKSADVPKVTRSKSGHSNTKRLLLLKSKSKEEKTASSSKRGRKTLLRYETEPRPGRVIRDRSHDEDAEESKNFLKLDVKYITDGEGVVSGTMLVTPNAIMFDPNVSDPLVKERGTSPYGVITQMDAVRGAAMYHDISAMSIQTKAECSGARTCPVYVPENMKNIENQSPTAPDVSSPTADAKTAPPTDPKMDTAPPTDPKMDTAQTNPDPLLRTISTLSDGFVVVVSDVEKSEQMAGTGTNENSCDPIPENTTSGEIFNVDTDTNKDLGNYINESGLHNGEVNCETSNENAISNDANVCTTAENTVCEQNENDNVLHKDSNVSPNINGISTDELITEIDDTQHFTGNRCSDSGLTEKTPVAESENPISQDNGVNIESKCSLPDLIESAEQSAKDLEPSVSESGPTELTNKSPDGAKWIQPRRCSFCHGTLMPKLKASPEVPSFVDFSSGIFLRECKCGVTAVPDITESLQDTSMTEKELEAIQAEGREIRRHSDLLAELPDEGNKELPLEATQEIKKTEDANKEVVLGYNKTNFEEYLPKPAQRYDDPPLYLCLRVGRPMSKTFPGSSEGKESVCKRHPKLPEYWFAIPREKADNLYAFFLQWSPDVYGKDGNQDDVGFVAVDEELESSLEVVEDFFDEPIGKDWEIITKEEANRRRMTILECEMNLPLPELEGATSILLEPEHVRKLTKQLPARTEGYSWKNIYSTAENGYSLRSLYRSMNGIDCPVLMVIRDSSGMIFGALSPCPIRVSEHYYGTGETFLFNFIDWELNCYRWTGDNNFFIKGNYNSLTLGGGDGAFGLWLDGDLYRGRSRSCKTFSNPCLAHDEDFIIADLEAWGFGLG